MTSERSPWFLALACVTALLTAACAGPDARGAQGTRLSGLQVRATPGAAGPLSPPFSADTTSYSVSVESHTSEVEIIPTVSVPATHRIRVGGALVPSGAAAAVLLKGADTTVEIDVGSDEGPRYTVHFLKEDSRQVEDAFQRLTWVDEETGISMGYRLFVPAGYTPDRQWPLVLFLHGAGESGSDNDAQIVSYQAATVWAKPAEQARHPCFVLAPQNPKITGAFTLSPYGNRGWTTLLSRGFGSPYQPEPPLAAVYTLLKKVLGEYAIDQDRLYATGLSMGGFGIFALNAAHPDTFAAVVSVCGGLDPEKAALLAGKPIWLFHAAADPLVNVRFSRLTVDALRAAGGTPRYTEYPVGTPFVGSSPHNSWIAAYADAEMRDWLFAQRRVTP
jgi:predicted esterase